MSGGPERDETTTDERDESVTDDRDEATARSSDSSTDASQSESHAASPPTTPTERMASETHDDGTTALGDEQSFRNNVERYVRYLLVAGLSLLALIAMLRFYFAASETIDTWVSPGYRSLFQALFNLALLLLAGAGIGWQARKLR